MPGAHAFLPDRHVCLRGCIVGTAGARPATEKSTEWEHLSGSLRAYLGLMNEASALLIKRLTAAVSSGASIDIHAALGDMTMQVVGTAAFGCASKALKRACSCNQQSLLSTLQKVLVEAKHVFARVSSAKRLLPHCCLAAQAYMTYPLQRAMQGRLLYADRRSGM